MDSIKNILAAKFTSALALAYPSAGQADAMIQPASQPRFGDYQANFAMTLAKRSGQKPRDVAERVLAHLETSDVWEKLEIAGPGFINISLSETFLQRRLQALLGDARLGVPLSPVSQRVVVDYSGANVAKEMHVGHLRSSIIGDCIARVLEFQGHHVLRQNHVGDWGTQFGMLIEYMLDSNQLNTEELQIGDLNALYRQAKSRFDAQSEFADRARQRVVALQSGDIQSTAIWQGLVEVSKRHFEDIFQRLGIGLREEHMRGESFYNPQLSDLVQTLQAQNFAKIDQGALVMELEGFVDRQGHALPLLIQKSDGGYLYATTDLAAARYRITHLGAKRIIYVTDARQSQHFSMLFAALRKTGWATEQIELEHVAFGAMLGEDKKPFKTRSGEMITLSALIDEACERATHVLREKNPELDADEVKVLAQAIGVAALKYADLKTERVKDYLFGWERMISFEGNTAPYLLNAYVRILSLFRKANLQVESVIGAAQPIVITHARERELAIRLLEFPDIVDNLGRELLPHRLCNYLYDIASTYHQFYEACPVLAADTDAQRDSRLALCVLTERCLQLGLNLLGINTVEKM